MTIIVAGLEDWAAGSVYVGHKDLSNEATVTASSAATDWPVGSLKNWFPQDRWKSADATDQTITVDLGSAKSVNSFGLYKHNLGSVGAELKIEYSSDGSSWTQAGITLQPSDDSTIYRLFTAIERRYWRLTMTGLSDQAIIGVLFLGHSLRWHSGPQEGFSPLGMNYNDDIINNQSQGGEFLGRRVIVLGGTTTLELRWAPPAWVRANYLDFIDEIRLHPFFLAWNADGYPSEVAFCWTSGAIQPVTHQSAMFLRHSLDLVTR